VEKLFSWVNASQRGLWGVARACEAVLSGPDIHCRCCCWTSCLAEAFSQAQATGNAEAISTALASADASAALQCLSPSPSPATPASPPATPPRSVASASRAAGCYWICSQMHAAVLCHIVLNAWQKLPGGLHAGEAVLACLAAVNTPMSCRRCRRMCHTSALHAYRLTINEHGNRVVYVCC
jgi:hypothetical protein